MSETTYAVIKWNQDMGWKGWPRFEVRPDPLQADLDYEIIKRGLSETQAFVLLEKLVKEERHGRLR